MTGNRANLVNYKVCNTGPDIRFAGGEINPTIGVGDLKLGALIISDVLHVEGYLLSMSQFAKKRLLYEIQS